MRKSKKTDRGELMEKRNPKKSSVSGGVLLPTWGRKEEVLRKRKGRMPPNDNTRRLLNIGEKKEFTNWRSVGKAPGFRSRENMKGEDATPMNGIKQKKN